MTISFGQIITPIDDCGANPVYERYYQDSDRDFYGNPNVFMDRCGPAPGWTFNNTDCDDTDPDIKGPKRWYADTDNDGLGDPNGLSTLDCTRPIGFVDNNNDCDDTDSTIGNKTAYYIDNDKDGQASITSVAEYHCTNPSTATTHYVTVANRTDCDDNDSSVLEITWYIDTDGDGFGENSNILMRCTKPSSQYVRNNDDLCPGINGSNNGCPPAGSNTAEYWNTIKVTTYDVTETDIAKNKSYFDDYGKSVQTQTKDYKTGKTWATQTLYDNQGRPALQTLNAPTNQDIPTDFLYRKDFIKKSNGSTFTETDFETDPENPSIVGTQPNSLGWYYSENNTTENGGETYQDITSYPYSRTIYSELNPGVPLKTIGGNKMDNEWKNGYVFSMPAGRELSQSVAFGDTKYDNYKVFKTITRDVHGIETVIFTDTDGKVLASARSGNEEGNTSTRISVVRIGKQRYVDIHIPVGTKGIDVRDFQGWILNNDSRFDVYDLITEELITIPFKSLESGFYRIAIVDGSTSNYTINYPENYYDYSLNEYDEAGRLISSYQPLNKLKSEFRYNALGQLTYTKSPDEGEAWFKYRKDGQIRYSQNSKQRATNQMSYTNYDQKGRPVESGVYTGFKPINFETLDPDGLGFPGSLSEQQFTAYDAVTQDDINALPANYKDPSFLAGNVAKTSNDHTTSYYSYDNYGRVQWVVQDIAELGFKTIDYEYDPITSQVTQVIYQKYQAADRFIHRYTYYLKDYSLIKVETAIDSDMPFTEHATYKYYETGGLKQLNLAEGLQKIDYVYNLNGALKSINHPNLNAANDPGGNNNDLFGMNLHYYNGDYNRSNTPKPIPNTSPGINNYNGNIKAMTWNTKGQNNSKPDTYYYTYDKNNWLTGASFNQTVNEVDPNIPLTLVKSETITAAETAEATQSIKMQPGFKVTATSSLTFTTSIAKDGTVQGDGDYNVSGITYDANGNIQSLTRNKQTENGSNAMDKLSYNYDATKPNQLKQVTDDAGDVDGADDIDTQINPDNYVYNEIGQLVKNKEENIDYFYNASGLVTEVHKDNTPLVKFFYNDKNHRVRKESFNPTNSSITTTFYVRDAAGMAMAVYNKFDANVSGGGSASPSITEHTIYGAQRLGVYKRYKNSGGHSLYQLTDHLGNVRAVVGRMTSGQELAITSATDYYPFGMPMPGRTLSGAEGYRYAYQGQEKDTETGKEAFQLRLWDSRIGRWLTTDPYGQYSSPYLGMGNDPINGIDSDGGWKSWWGAAWAYLKGGFGGKIQRNTDSEFVAANPDKEYYITQDIGGDEAGFKFSYDYDGYTLNNLDDYDQEIISRYGGIDNLPGRDRSLKSRLVSVKISDMKRGNAEIMRERVGSVYRAGAEYGLVGSGIAGGIRLPIRHSGNFNIGKFTFSIWSRANAGGMTGRRVIGFNHKPFNLFGKKFNRFQAALDYHNWPLRPNGATPINQKFWHYHFGGSSAGKHHRQLFTGNPITNPSQLKKNRIFGWF
ncbi:hypothetical protein GCM10022259_21270 [Aquimarina mytili]